MHLYEILWDIFACFVIVVFFSVLVRFYYWIFIYAFFVSFVAIVYG